MKKSISITLVIILSSMMLSTSSVFAGTQGIRNFNQVSKNFGSAGMPSNAELVALKNDGYQHIINLIPGDYTKEKDKTESLQMTFNQIPVEWSNPTVENFRAFSHLMAKYKKDKVLVHCQMNYRASAFAYLHEVTQQGIDKNTARKKMLSVWQPNETWQTFIDKVEREYSR